MLHKLRERAQSEKGFTLIELLVVILIIGILAAIAIPAFLGQREKAQDGGAKTQARNAATAMEAIYTDDQSYGAGDQLANAKKIEPTLGTENVTVTVTGAGADGYTITAVHANTGHVFTLEKDAATSTVDRTCVDLGEGGCPADGTW
jgi:type IV pilus assembly protein PilA